MSDRQTVIGSFGGGPGGQSEGHTVILNLKKKPLAFFVLMSGVYVGTPLILHAEVTKFGRDGTKNDYALDDDSVSSLHASVRLRDGEFTITDLDSRNGTKVNGQPISRHVLSTNDRVMMGRTKLVFLKLEDELRPDE